MAMRQKPKVGISRKKAGSSGGIPVAYSSSCGTSMPVWQGAPGGVRIHHRELAQTLRIATGGQFVLDPVSGATPGLDLNPACSAVFPWLSGVAINFERYRFGSLKFRFMSAQATTAAGRVYAGVDLDYDDPVPTSARSVMTNRYAKEAPLWESFEMSIPGKDLMREMPYKYITASTRTNFVEPRTAYAGFLCFGGNHSLGSDALWDLWVEYDVELNLPVLESVQFYDTFGATNGAALLTPYTQLQPQIAVGVFARQLGASLASPGSPLKLVKSGVDGTPTLASALFDGGGVSGRTAYDLIQLTQRKGKLTLQDEMIVTAATPANVMAGGTHRMAIEQFRSDGSAIGPPQYLDCNAGSPDQTTWNSNPGPFWRVLANPLDLATLFATGLGAATRYLVASVVTNFLVGPGSARSGWKLEL